MWNDCIGMMEGSGQGKLEDWSVRISHGGEVVEPCPCLCEWGTGSYQGFYEGGYFPGPLQRKVELREIMCLFLRESFLSFLQHLNEDSMTCPGRNHLYSCY
jgi:hypothetical protein